MVWRMLSHLSVFCCPVLNQGQVATRIPFWSLRRQSSLGYALCPNLSVISVILFLHLPSKEQPQGRRAYCSIYVWSEFMFKALIAVRVLPCVRTLCAQLREIPAPIATEWVQSQGMWQPSWLPELTMVRVGLFLAIVFPHCINVLVALSYLPSTRGPHFKITLRYRLLHAVF